MRRILSVAILALCLLAPVKRLDVAKLEPVQTVAIYSQGGKVVLETDTGNRGEGVDAAEALGNLKQNALAVIYLDTAEYLLVGEGDEQLVGQLLPVLHKRVKVALYGGGDIVEETAYWEVHGDLPKLEQWKARSLCK